MTPSATFITNGVEKVKSNAQKSRCIFDHDKENHARVSFCLTVE